MEIIAGLAEVLENRSRVEVLASIALMAELPTVQQTARFQPHNAVDPRLIAPLVHNLPHITPRLFQSVEVQSAALADGSRRLRAEEAPPRSTAVDVVEQRIRIEQRPADVEEHAYVFGVSGDDELAKLRDCAELLVHHTGEIDAQIAPAVRNGAVAAVLLDGEQLQRVDAKVREVTDLVGELTEIVVSVVLSEEGWEKHLVDDGLGDVVEREFSCRVGRGDAICLSRLVKE